MLNAPRAGVARYLLNMLAEMMRLAPDVEFLLYSPRKVEVSLPPGRWRLFCDSGWRGKVANYWVQRRLPDLLAQDRVQVFWGQNHFVPQRLRHNCRRVVTVHDITPLLFPQTMGLKSRLGARLFLRSAVRCADRIVAVSQMTAQLLTKLLGVDRARLSVIYPGAAASFSPVDRAEARKVVAAKYGLPERFVLSVGTIEPRKNHALLLRALGMVEAAPLLVVVGQPGWRCGQIVRELELWQQRGRVRLLREVDDSGLRLLYSAALLMVMPSLYEGFGSPVVEAMACGCPVLCSWSSSLPEVGGQAARYFCAGDAADLAQRLEEMMEDPAELERMAADGITQAKRFSYELAAQQMLELMLTKVADENT